MLEHHPCIARSAPELVELIKAASLSVVASCGPHLLEGRLKAGESYRIANATVSLFLQDRTKLGSLKWLVRIEHYGFSATIVFFSSEEDFDVVSGRQQYSWPVASDEDNHITFDGDKKVAEIWLKENRGTIGMDWSGVISEPAVSKFLSGLFK